MDFITPIIFGGTLLYIGLLLPALLEADRRTAAKEAFLPNTPQHGGLALTYCLMIGCNGLLLLPASCLTYLAFTTGVVCGFVGLMLFFSPIVAFFMAITRRPAQNQTRWIRVLWRAGVYFGILALMLSFAFAACSAQEFKLKH